MVRSRLTVAFGSARQGGCHFLFCDGSVRQIACTIDRDLHRNLGKRKDSEVVDF